MGTCASSHKGKRGSDTKLDYSKFGAKADRAIVLPEPPLTDSKPAAIDFRVRSFDDLGGKEETFFDSRAWIDSDCEDDFFSVNGDFTPSRGNTPVHHKFSAGSPQVCNAPVAEGLFGYAAQPSPSGKKRLSELFQESVGENHDGADDEPRAPGSGNLLNGNAASKQTIRNELPRSLQNTSYISGANNYSTPGSERTTNVDCRAELDDVFMKSGQCCLPRMLSSRSLTERKKRMMSPAVAVGGKA